MVAALDWGAVVLPTLLAIAGIIVSLETPFLESRSQRTVWAARAGLFAFGLLVSALIAVQQSYLRHETAEVTELLGTLADAAKVDRSGSASSITEQILQKLPSTDWHLTDEQKQKLGQILDSAPDQSRFPIDVRAASGSKQSQVYQDELANVFQTHRWSVTAAVDPAIRSDLVGLTIALSPDVKTAQDVPPNARILASVFEQSNIPFKVGNREGVAKNAFQLDVGSPPPQ
jgi:hypothetical protein